MEEEWKSKVTNTIAEAWTKTSKEDDWEVELWYGNRGIPNPFGYGAGEENQIVMVIGKEHSSFKIIVSSHER